MLSSWLKEFKKDLIIYMLGRLGKEPVYSEEDVNIVFKDVVINESDYISILNNKISRIALSGSKPKVDSFRAICMEIIEGAKKDKQELSSKSDAGQDSLQAPTLVKKMPGVVSEILQEPNTRILPVAEQSNDIVIPMIQTLNNFSKYENRDDKRN